jgi:hypothetical protein
MLSYLIKNNESRYEFTFLLNTQEVDNTLLESLKTYYTLPTHHLKGIIQMNCNHCVKDAYSIRLYQCLKSEELNAYDLYVNMRFDTILTGPIQLDHYKDRFCIITGNWERECGYHNRDWDLMSVGNRFNYLLYHYPMINHELSNHAFVCEPFPDLLQVKDITEEEITHLNTRCGLITNLPNKDYSIILKNMLVLKGRFFVSEKLDGVHVNLLR